jgi:hypothetical protein
MAADAEPLVASGGRSRAIGSFLTHGVKNVKKIVFVIALLCGAGKVIACEDHPTTIGAAVKTCLDVVHKIKPKWDYASLADLYSRYDAYYQTSDNLFKDNAWSVADVNGPRFEFYKCLAGQGVALRDK